MNIVLSEQLIEPCNDTCGFCFLNYADLISSNYLFNDFKPKEVGEMIRNIKHQVKTFEKGDVIAHNNDIINSLYVIVKGRVVAEVMGNEGKILRIEELKAPDTIGSSFIYGKQSRLPYDVIAKEFVKALIIPKDNFLDLLMSNKKLLVNYFNIISCRAQRQSNKMQVLGLNSLKGKIADYLLELSDSACSAAFILKQTQTDMAELFGVARPSVSRIFKELSDKEIISLNGKHVVILNEDLLRKQLR